MPSKGSVSEQNEHKKAPGGAGGFDLLWFPVSAAYQGFRCQFTPTVAVWMSCLASSGPASGKFTVLVPKSMKLYSANTDQLGANMYSRPPPAVQPTRFAVAASTGNPRRATDMSSLVQAAPPFA